MNPRALNAFVQLAMGGNAAVQSERQTRKVAEQQVKDAQGAEVTLARNPDGSTYIKRAKNLTTEMLSGTMDAALQEARDKPFLDVEAELQRRGLYIAPPDDPVDTFREGYRASRRLGGGVFGAFIDALEAKFGNIDQETVERKFRELNYDRFADRVKPVLDEEQEIERAQLANDREERLTRSTIASTDASRYVDFRNRDLSRYESFDDVVRDAEAEGFQLHQSRLTSLRHKWKKDQHAAELSAEEAERKREKEQRDEEKHEMQQRRLELSEELAREFAEGRATEKEIAQQNKLIDLTAEQATRYQKEIEPFEELADQAAKAEAFARRGTGDADYGLILLFISSIDNSVARESEVRTARSTVSLLDTLKVLKAKWKEGDLLTPELRNRIVETQRALVRSLEPRRRRVDEKYKARAEAWGLRPDLIGIPGAAGDPLGVLD